MKLRHEWGDTLGRLLPHRTQSDDHDTQGGDETSRQGGGGGKGDRRRGRRILFGRFQLIDGQGTISITSNISSIGIRSIVFIHRVKK